MAKAKTQAGEQQIKLAPINRQRIKMRIVGTSPMIQHQWDEKAKEMMRLKHAGKKTKERAIRDPEAEGKAAMYVDWENRFVIMDCMIFCHFYRDLLDWEFITRISNAALGLDDTPATLSAKANRIVGETHSFNTQRGFGPGQEGFGKWITERPIIAQDGEELRTTAEQFEVMRREYYAARSWGGPAGA